MRAKRERIISTQMTEIERMWGMKTTVIPVVIGIFKLVKKSIKNYCTFRKCSYPKEKFIHEVNHHILMVAPRSNSFQSPLLRVIISKGNNKGIT